MEIIAIVSSFGRTDVEMEATTATMGSALTVYDMLKSWIWGWRLRVCG
jgi:molybdenum cofactor biosynthesis enzyme